MTVAKVPKAIVELLCAMMMTFNKTGSCPLGKCKVCRASFTSTSGSKKSVPDKKGSPGMSGQNNEFSVATVNHTVEYECTLNVCVVTS